jgi:hypothetical protein
MIHKTTKKNSISFDHRRSFLLVLLRPGQQVFNKTYAGVVLNILETGSVHAARVYSFHVSVIVLQ